MILARYTAKPLTGNWKLSPHGGNNSEKAKACKLCKDKFSVDVPRREVGDGTAATCTWCFNAQRKKNCRGEMDLVMPDGTPREALVAEPLRIKSKFLIGLFNGGSFGSLLFLSRSLLCQGLCGCLVKEEVRWQG